MSDWVPVIPSLRTDEWLKRHGAELGKPFTCPVCKGSSASVTHTPGEWPVFGCPTCPTVPTIHDLIAKWPILDGDCEREAEARAGQLVPRDPAYEPPVTVLPLGYDDTGMYYYQNSVTGHISKISPSQHKEDSLYGITPDFRYWYWAYGKEGDATVDWKKAARAMMAECQLKGRFRLEDMRGGGVWIDRGRIVANLGTHLLVDGVETKIQGFDSIYMYDAMIKAIRLPSPATRAELARIAPLIHRLPFTDGTGGVSVGGMLIIGLLCGILTWRPHLWMTGAAESGKTTILKYIFGRLWKPCGAAITDESTSAAGIRQRALKHSAVPVVMDESEADDIHGLQRVRAIVKMARSASSDGDAVVFKGNQSGSGVEFNVRSCFVLCSIVESLTTPQDRQRFTVVQCEKSKASVDGWPALRAELEKVMTPETGLAIYAAVIRDARIIQDNIARASVRVFTLMGGDSRRHADQLGSFIAGHYYLTNQGDTITEKDIDRLFYSMNHREIRDEIAMQDDTPIRCLNQIYSYKPMGERLTLGESVNAMIDEADRGLSAHYTEAWKMHRAILKRFGLDVEQGVNGGPHYLHIALKHPELIDMLERRGFSTHSKLLKRLKGAKAGKTRRFGMLVSHTVAIPLSGGDDDGAPAPEDVGKHSIEDLSGELFGQASPTPEDEDFE